MPFRKILCATDFSKSALAAFEKAIDLGGPLQSTIVLLHVYQRSRATPVSMAGRPTHDQEDAYADRFQAKLRELIEATDIRGLRVSPLLAEGAAWERIVSEAQKIGADLIVLGRNGRAGRSQLFVGSVATRVVKHADVPVMTVRA